MGKALSCRRPVRAAGWRAKSAAALVYGPATWSAAGAPFCWMVGVTACNSRAYRSSSDLMGAPGRFAQDFPFGRSVSLIGGVFRTWMTAVESLLFRWLEGSGSREAANANLAQG